MEKILLEVCCGSVDDVLEAERGGADRVELNACLFHGGLTPSVGTVMTVKEMAKIPVMAMIRPRQGGFCYTDAEWRTAQADAKALLRAGADGLVFGFLNDDGTLDEARCRVLVELAEGRPTVFHRAIDVMADWKRALDTLIRLGVRRVLTSGQEPNVMFGLDTVAEMIRYAQGAIEIMPGAGVTSKNIARIVRETGCTQVHIARHKTMPDHSTANNNEIFYGGALYPPEDRFEVTDGDYIAQAIRNCNA